MLRILKPAVLLLPFCGLMAGPDVSLAQQVSESQSQACATLQQLRNLTITSASIRANDESENPYCYVRGIISPAIHFHVQLPLPEHWNGRFLQWGDGGKDGDLDFANHRVAEGYAVANSNMGHDSGTEPGSSFAYNNRQAEIDFGYRAVHLTVMAGKTLVRSYYRQAPDYSYFEGCSTGGREGLMEAQRYPNDFDGIVAGAPAYTYQALNVAGTWLLQRIFRDNMIGNLAVDTNGDGAYNSLNLVEILNDKVLGTCDANDGIIDGVIDDPFSCEFDPVRDLSDLSCPTGSSSDSCFTDAQMQTITDFYAGPHDDNGVEIYPGKLPGSELQWIRLFVPHAGNRHAPSMLTGPAGDHMNYLFYEEDPGVTIPDITDSLYQARKGGAMPEYSWMEFDLNDYTSGKADLMMSITDATDPDLRRFLKDRGGKLIVYHGLVDSLIVAESTRDYYDDMVDATFAGDLAAAKNSARLFLAPGMAHCAGGPGPNSWDKLAPLVDWVENGNAPDAVIATHSSNGQVDNERLLCAVPQQARYIGPAGAANNPSNWTADNFQCR
ncbi:MAG: tannase/feruloyl esterase family alpha/beta hydrolase [Proteobacteria bacterium]|nr:tannase/feruloyl esterase family alpha/beta hydrolase [Pseudomonadota bacterium]